MSLRRYRPHRLALVAVASGVIALGGDLHAQGLIVSGYGDLEWTLEDRGEADGWRHAFDNHHLNLILLGAIMEDITVGVEVEYEHAGEEIAVEYAYLSYRGIPGFSITGGKFIVPFNRWNKDLHPTWISKMPGRPLTYVNVFPSTYSDVGLWFSGGLPLGETGSRFTYDAYVVNGLEGDADASNFRGLRDNDRERPRRGNDKALGGRVGLEVAGGLGVGVSAYTGEYAADEATNDGLRLTFFGADADYRYEALELRGELIVASQDLSAGAPDNDRTGFYVQAAYEVAPNFEPVVRYSWVDFEEDSGDRSEFGLGFSYYLASSTAVRLAYFVNMERHGLDQDNDRLMGQFVVAF